MAADKLTAFGHGNIFPMIERPYLACAVQLTSTPDLEATLAQAEALVCRAAARGAELIGLPENFPQLCASPEDALAEVETAHPRAEAWLTDLARRLRVVLFGAMPVPGTGPRVRNTLVVAGRDGQVLASYAKRHLFDVQFGGPDTLQESASVEPGEAVVTVDLGELGVLGLAICYDLRFPEHFRALVDRGAELMALPAAFLGLTGKDHWQVLLRARAIENTCYVLAPAQTGRHNPRRASYGHSLVVDPWGHVLADAGDEPGLAIAEIDPDRLARIRAQLPSLSHRLPGI